MKFAWYDIVGTAGVATIIATYVLLQTERLRSDSLAYSAMNAAGATLIVLSLVFNFNFAAFVVEFFWIVISLYGIFRAIRRKVNKTEG